MRASRYEISFILLLLCAALMPLTIYPIWTVNGGNGNGGGGGGNGRGGGGGGIPNINIPTGRPNINQPPNGNQFTARPTINVPSASFTRPNVMTSFSFSRTIATSFSFSQSVWTGISFTRTVVTSYTFNPTFTIATSTAYPYGGGGYYGGWTFVQYPPNYNSNVGSFTLDQTLTGQNDLPCAYYTYFEFNANGGQQFQARLWTSSAQAVNYVIVPQSLLATLQQMGCGYASSGTHNQVQSFSSQISLNWTAPQTGQYAIIFYSLTPYNGPIYFLPGAQ